LSDAAWAAAVVSALGACVIIAGALLDAIPPLSKKAERAIVSLRRLRETWKGDDPKSQD